MMADIYNVIKGLPQLLELQPASEEMISDSERRLSLSFAAEYKDYLRGFGAILAQGVELTGIASSKHRHVVSVTKREWKLNPHVPQTFYVVENLGIDGIIIWQNSQGEIYESTPTGEIRPIANSLVEYLTSGRKG